MIVDIRNSEITKNISTPINPPCINSKRLERIIQLAIPKLLVHQFG